VRTPGHCWAVGVACSGQSYTVHRRVRIFSFMHGSAPGYAWTAVAGSRSLFWFDGSDYYDDICLPDTRQSLPVVIVLGGRLISFLIFIAACMLTAQRRVISRRDLWWHVPVENSVVVVMSKDLKGKRASLWHVYTALREQGKDKESAVAKGQLKVCVTLRLDYVLPTPYTNALCRPMIFTHVFTFQWVCLTIADHHRSPQIKHRKMKILGLHWSSVCK